MLLASACQNERHGPPGGSDGGLGAMPASTVVIDHTTGKESVAQPKQQESEREIPIDSPRLIAEGTAEASGGETIVRVWLKSGKQMTDDTPGPFQGTFLYGAFVIEAVTADGKTLPGMPLNDVFSHYGTVSFKAQEPFELLFDDYNADGNPDFTIGQWAGSNGNEYAMVTVDEDGLHILTILYSADHRGSIRYPKVDNTAFLNKYYDIETGYKDVIYRWRDGEFAAEAPTHSQEAGSAGVEDQK